MRTPGRDQGLSDRAEAAAHVPRRLRLQHAGREPAGRRQRQPAHPDAEGKIATPIVEIKNLNSFRDVERALAYEAERQYEVWQETGRKLGDPGVPKQTRGWDDAKGMTFAQREKEESSDYRYFPDPDLVPRRHARGRDRGGPQQPDRAAGGDSPAAGNKLRHHAVRQRRDRVARAARLVDYYEAVAKLAGDGKKAANWVQQEVMRVLNEQGWTLAQFPLTAAALGELVKLVVGGRDRNHAGQGSLQRHGRQQALGCRVDAGPGHRQGRSSELEAICQEIVAANPKIVADVKAGKQQAVGALLGQAKKKNPNANPNDVRRICLEIIAKL